MNRSELIKLISEIATKLADEEWSLINLTLRQFGLPWTDTWNSSDKHDYVISMVEDADDQTLLDLASHLGLEHSDSSTEIFALTSEVNELIKEIDRH